MDNSETNNPVPLIREPRPYGRLLQAMRQPAGCRFTLLRQMRKARGRVRRRADDPEDFGLSGTGCSVHVRRSEFASPADHDCFNHYRKLAKAASERLRYTFHTRIHDLDTFLGDFMGYYLMKREPLLRQAYGTLAELGYYDVSVESFTNQHTVDFCLIKEDLETMINISMKRSRRTKWRGPTGST